MPKNLKLAKVELPGDPHESIQTYAWENPTLTTPHKELVVGQRVWILDPSLIDQATGQHAKIPTECVFAQDAYGARYYYFRAVDDEDLNTLDDPKFNFKYYSILESTSPYILV